MVAFKPGLQSAKDCDRIFNRRLGNHDLLETAFQGTVFFNILAVLIKCGRTDALEFASCQHRLEQVGRIHGTFGLTGSDQVMKLIDEENDLTVCLLYLIQYAFETFLKFTAVLRTGNHCAHIQFDQTLVGKSQRYIIFHDPPCETFYDCGFTNARFTDQNRIVLCLSGKDLDHPADLFISSDDRIDPSVFYILYQIMSVLLQGIKLAFIGLSIHFDTTPAVCFRLFNIFFTEPEFLFQLPAHFTVGFQQSH